MKLIWRVIVTIFVLIAVKVVMDTYQILKVAASGDHIRIDPALYFNLSYLTFGLVGLMLFSDIIKRLMEKQGKQYKY
ncbi:hypothetical protein FIU87_06090 [Bacillus sp. THAF10]|uniref:hypothetical protein n=1 Tax=Bacillus sp. THAF10 TaxID=2587848 RepID=UPI001269695A|nr:hypothetical protein [Bacillus sp. THAF10]QFT88204.1 hypothetical protein FIU87_06090 [Bacillus sp. THAF10]